MLKVLVAIVLALSFVAGAAEAGGKKKFSPGPGNSHSGQGHPGKSGGGRS